jgi:hypothetical protein
VAVATRREAEVAAAAWSVVAQGCVVPAGTLAAHSASFAQSPLNRCLHPPCTRKGRARGACAQTHSSQWARQLRSACWLGREWRSIPLAGAVPLRYVFPGSSSFEIPSLLHLAPLPAAACSPLLLSFSFSFFAWGLWGRGYGLTADGAECGRE